MTDQSEKTTHFGARDVPESEKAGLVHEVFSNVASKYDVMNDVMSVGIHRLWKDAMMDWLAPRNGQRLLDVAGGTGDIAFRFLRRAPDANAVVTDMTEQMLVEGRKRAEAETFGPRLDWVTGDAMALPFPDAAFDTYTISFGIRNVTRIGDALGEAHRVLKPGGHFVALDHRAAAGAGPETGGTTHRIDPAIVVARAASAGLALIQESDVLANDTDDYDKNVFDPGVRRQTDRFLLKFEKR